MGAIVITITAGPGRGDTVDETTTIPEVCVFSSFCASGKADLAGCNTDLYRGSGTANRGGSGSSSRGGDFDQYDAGDDEDVSSSARPTTTAPKTSSAARASKGKASSAASSSPAPAAPPAAAPKPIVDLFDFDDEVPAPSAPAMPAAPPSDLVDDGKHIRRPLTSRLADLFPRSVSP